MSDLNNQTTVQDERRQGVSDTIGHSKIQEKAPERYPDSV